MEKTPEMIAAEQAAAQKAIDEKARVAAEKKAAKEREAAEKKAAKDAAKAASEAAKAEAKAKKEAEKAAKAAEKAAKATQKQPEQNGVVRPKDGTSCGKIWSLADQLSAKKKSPVTIKELLETGTAEGYNEATIKTQYARWRKYFGVTGRLVTEVPTAPAAPADDSATPVAE